jgi:molecular chaperone GrpE (heat shock protein)
MYKNLIPADHISRERHPMEQSRCYAGPVDVAALQEQLKEQHERYLRMEAEFADLKKRMAQCRENAQGERNEP